VDSEFRWENKKGGDSISFSHPKSLHYASKNHLEVSKKLPWASLPMDRKAVEEQWEAVQRNGDKKNQSHQA
jgi:hypothetical protein